MHNYVVNASKLTGTIKLPPFKSEAIRFALLYALSGVRPSSVIHLPDKLSDDISFAIIAADALYDSINLHTAPEFIVGESATLFRLLLPMVLALFGKGKFLLGTELLKRGIYEYVDTLGCMISVSGNWMTVSSNIRSNTHNCYTVSVKRSSQFASGLLMAMPLLSNAVMRISNSPSPSERMVSMPYFNMTKKIMKIFGVTINESVNAQFTYFSVNQQYVSPKTCNLSGDTSYAANFIVANYFGSEVKFANYPKEKHADSIIFELLDLNNINIIDSPDLFPILAVAACKKHECTIINGTDRLRSKESDRIQAMSTGITSLGGCITIGRNCVKVFGSGKLNGGVVNSFFDHRVAMAFAIASQIADEPITILNASCVSKSAPQFFDDFIMLGGTVNELNR